MGGDRVGRKRQSPLPTPRLLPGAGGFNPAVPCFLSMFPTGNVLLKQTPVALPSNTLHPDSPRLLWEAYPTQGEMGQSHHTSAQA